jgi:hypothetical protein
MHLKTSELINDLKLAGSFPDGMFTDADFISFLNTGYSSEIVPFIMRHREDFFVTYQDQDYSDTIAIPSDAIAQKLKDVVRVDSSGRLLGNVPRVSIEEITGHQQYYKPVGFYIEDNNVKFHPAGATTDRIRLYYFKRPHHLIQESLCTEVTSVSGVNVTGTVPSTWTTSTAISVTDKTQPYDIDDSYTIVSLDVGAGTLELSASGLVVGDFICPLGYSAIPKIPTEMRDVLIQSAIINALVSLKDINGVKLAREELFIAMDNMSGLISPRVEGEPKKIVNNSGIWATRSRNKLWR